MRSKKILALILIIQIVAISCAAEIETQAAEVPSGTVIEVFRSPT